jgi:hypothetical protein
MAAPGTVRAAGGWTPRRIADPSQETDRETAELEGFQSSVNAMIPIPPNVNAIEDYRREKRDG